ncbi:MAG: MATE family efflux transporter [Actinomycetota bacterium]|nr:MATE family efflux transporter [Actinomycetota bacterium]
MRLREKLLTARHSSGLWAIIDQGIVSIGTFAVTVILARRLPASEFGVFGVLLGIQVMALTVHTSLIGIPLMVFTGRSTRPDHLPTVALGLAAILTGPFAVAMTAAVFVLERPGVLPWAVLALVGLEIQETLRRSMMGRLQFRRVAGGDAVSYLGQAAGAALVTAVGRPTVSSALGVMGLSSLAAAALQLWQVRPAFGARAFSRDTVEPFWRLGRALVGINGIGALTVQAVMWLLGALHGVAAVGSYQALLAVVSPTNPMMIAANSIVTTRASNLHEPELGARRRDELRVARRYGIALGIPFAAYCVVLLVAPRMALSVFFGPSSAYRSLSTDLRILVGFSIAQYLSFVFAGVLNARQDTRTLLRSQLAGAVVVPLAVPVIAVGALGAAVAATSVSALARAAIAARGVLRR